METFAFRGFAHLDVGEEYVPLPVAFNLFIAEDQDAGLAEKAGEVLLEWICSERAKEMEREDV